MRFLIQTLVTLAFGALAGLFLPWWSVVVVAGLLGVAFHYQYVFVSFLSGLTAVALLWGGYAAFLRDDRMMTQMGELLHLNQPFWLVVLTALLGGLLAGLAAAAGSALRQLVTRQPAT